MVTKNMDFWLNEAELKTPIHDEMVLWSFNHADDILKESNINLNTKKYIIHDVNYPSVINKEKIIEYPLKGYNGFNLGYLDLAIKFKVSNGYFELSDESFLMIGFEIKPEVKSIGEVLRQFQYYKSNLPRGSKLILVTKTLGLKEIFEGQGFYVIEYKKEENKDGSVS